MIEKIYPVGKLYLHDRIPYVNIKITFRNEKERQFYESFEALQKSFGDRMAEKIIDRIGDLRDAENPQKLPRSSRFHEHSGGRKGLFSLDLIHPYRLIVFPTCEYETYIEITSVEIYEVTDPH